MHRLANPFTVVAVALAAQSAVSVAQTATTRVVVRGDTIVLKGDSTRGSMAERASVMIRRVDSLLRRQDGTPIGSPEFARIQRELETAIRSTIPGGASFVGPDGSVSIMVGPEGIHEMRRSALTAPRLMINVTPRGWLGIDADGFHQEWKDVDGYYVRYFEYPTVLGVDPNSPAAKIGVRFGDMLVAYDGVDLRRNAINLTRLLEPGRSLAVRLRRDGETKDLTVVVEKAPPSVEAERNVAVVRGMLMPSRAPTADSADRRMVEVRTRSAATAGFANGGGGFVARAPTPMAVMMSSGVLGARMTDLESAAIAALTQKKSSHGVLVTMVPPGSPAARMGMRGGDMIVTVGDADVMSISQLRETIARSPNHATQFVVVREGKMEKLTYEPR